VKDSTADKEMHKVQARSIMDLIHKAGAKRTSLKCTGKQKGMEKAHGGKLARPPFVLNLKPRSRLLWGSQ